MGEYKRKSIKEWSQDDRPREKLLLKGKASLSNAELIAILIGSGSVELSAVGLAKKLLSESNNDLNTLATKTVNELTQIKGIGNAKAVSIIAAIELSRRLQSSQIHIKPLLTSSQSAYDILSPLLSNLVKEEFWVLYLNRANRLIGSKQISSGGITGTVFDLRLIFKEAILLNATGLILAHNHPSGNLKPSQSDIDLTNKSSKAGVLMDINVLDHLIIGEQSYYSFADEGKI